MGHECVKNETGHSNFQFLNSPILSDTSLFSNPAILSYRTYPENNNH